MGSVVGGVTPVVPPLVVPPLVVLPEVVLPEVVLPEVVLPLVVLPEVVLPEVVLPEVVLPLVVSVGGAVVGSKTLSWMLRVALAGFRKALLRLFGSADQTHPLALLYCVAVRVRLSVG